jgi:hypothetical protein
MSEVEVLKGQLAEALRKIEHYQEMVKALEKVNKCHEENKEHRRKHPTSIFDQVPTKADILEMYETMAAPDFKTLTKEQKYDLIIHVKEEWHTYCHELIENALVEAIGDWVIELPE